MEANEREKERWALWELAMVVLALVSLGPIAWVELEGLHWPHPTFRVVALVDLVVVLVLAVDFVVRLKVAADKRAFWRGNWYELPGLIPLYAESLSWFRVARLLRLGRVLRLLRAVTAFKRLRRTVRFFDLLINRSKLGYMLAASLAVVLGMATVVWMLERHTNPSFANFDDALWWAIVTATTVGYGDITPQTGLARLCATVLMLTGIGLIGLVASSLSTSLIAMGGFEEEQPPAAESLAGELERLSALREKGHLTEEEFSAAKRKLLGLDAKGGGAREVA